MDIAAAFAALGWAKWLPVASAVVGLASLLAAILPQATPGSFYANVRKVLDFASLAVGNARTATAPGTPVTATTVPALAIAPTAAPIVKRPTPVL